MRSEGILAISSQVVYLIVILKDCRPEARRIDQVTGQEFPGKGDGFALEIVSNESCPASQKKCDALAKIDSLRSLCI